MIKFIDIEGLKEEIKTNTLSQSDSFVYLFILIIIFGAMNQGFGAELHTNTNIALFVATWVISGLGIIWAYIWNGGAQGSRFLEKYLSIGFVLSVRFIPLFIVATAVAVFLNTKILGQPFFGGVEEVIYTWFDVLAYAVVFLLIAWRLAKHTRDTRV